MGLCGVLLGVIRVEGLADPNVLWGTRDGLDILSSGHLPRADAWSWTVAGRHWIPNSWGWDVVLGSIHRLGGATALGLLNLVLIMVLVLGMARAAFRLGACGLAVVATIGALGGAILMPWVNARPQIISYVVILALVPWVRPALLTTRRRFVWALLALAAVQIVWVNLHFFAIIGPVLLAAAGVGHLLEAAASSKRPRSVSTSEQAARLILLVGIAAAA